MAFGGSSCIMTSVDTNSVEFFFFVFLFSEKGNLFKKIFSLFWGRPFRIGLQVREEPARMSPSRPARKEMVQGPVGSSQGAHNVEK